MNNYKELVAALREEAEAVKAVEWDIPICTSNHIAEAADAIDRLCFELELERCQHNATLKERDAAIADIRKALNRTEECLLCRWFDGAHGCRKSDKSCENSKTDEWEWRGVPEVEHGND